jgi:peptide subunit release factor 1 (eRF1)
VERELRKGGPKSLVLVGTEETTASFREQLSLEAQAAVAGVAHAEAHATPAELLEIVEPVLEEAAAARERDVLEHWREASARTEGRGVAGWEATLTAASDGKVACLLFTDGAAHAAVRCAECGRVEAAGETCPLDGGALELVGDGLDAAIHRVLAFGGDLIPIRHHQDLDPVGGIGALLRF